MRYIILLCFLLVAEAVGAQGVRRLTLADAVRLARTQSPDALSARHTFRSAYWNYRYYRANYLPSLTLTSDPSLDRSINQITAVRRYVRFVEQNFINSDLTLNLSQNVPFTGGVVTPLQLPCAARHAHRPHVLLADRPLCSSATSSRSSATTA